jgi:hypothetical protein
MRRITLFFAALFLALSLGALPSTAQETAKVIAQDTAKVPAQCTDKECKCKRKSNNLFTKLAWGVVDVIYAPAELLKVATCEPYDRGLAHDIPNNIGKGFCHMGRRVCASAYNTATSPIPVPSGYKPILKEEKQPCGMDNFEGGER